MPWYPWSDGRFTARFWDGERWLASLGNGVIAIEGRLIAAADIVAVSYWSQTIVGYSKVPIFTSGPTETYRGFSVTDTRGDTTTVNLDTPQLARNGEYDAALTGLSNFSRQFIEPRIAQGILDTLRAGGEHTVKDGWGFLTLSAGGFTGKVFKTRSYRWSDLNYVNVNPRSNNMSPWTETGEARVWARSPSNGKVYRVTGLRTRIPNVVVLSTLLPMCAAAFAPRTW